jgi:hypothetical protein
MPTKRRVDKARRHRISAEAIAAYRAKDCNALHRALGLRPWQASPLRVDQGPGPGGPTAYAASWLLAAELQRELEAALRGSGGGGRPHQAHSDDTRKAPDLPAPPA